ncbi:hypothetical protein AB1K56_13225 [Microbacterium sp. BWR-S6Y]|uniref:hypothetical protein n=1 Tax=Microbacterium sp. BWR-S6Y TaxID=3232073 RepID=UPI0035273A7C
MQLFSKKKALALVATGSVFMGLSGCSAPSAQPDPTAVVRTYLDAIAEGDAATATSMDPASVASDADADAEALRTDAVLQGAVERITDVEVDADARTDGSNDDARRVTFTYELAGQRVSSSLAVRWDQEKGDWSLTESVAGRLFVQASASAIDAEVIGYSVPGATVTVSDPPRLFQWAYPAVYEVTPDVDANLLSDPDAGTQTATVSPTEDTKVDVAVTSLPTPAS